jgi:hypothetical protein
LLSVERLTGPKRLRLTFDQSISEFSDALATQFTVPAWGPSEQPSDYAGLAGPVLDLVCEWPAIGPLDPTLSYVATPGNLDGEDSGQLQPFSGFPIPS